MKIGEKLILDSLLLNIRDRVDIGNCKQGCPGVQQNLDGGHKQMIKDRALLMSIDACEKDWDFNQEVLVAIFYFSDPKMPLSANCPSSVK